jgi:hypothetical protein
LTTMLALAAPQDRRTRTATLVSVPRINALLRRLSALVTDNPIRIVRFQIYRIAIFGAEMKPCLSE